MRKLSGAKDKLGLRVHGLIVGSPEKKRSDPAVLRSICSSILPNGKNEVRVHYCIGTPAHAVVCPKCHGICQASDTPVCMRVLHMESCHKARIVQAPATPCKASTLLHDRFLCRQMVRSAAVVMLAVQVLVTEFEGWASVEGDKELAFDWDDTAGEIKRRQQGLRLEALRLAEMKRRKAATRGGGGGGTDKELGSKAMAEAMRASRQKKE